MQGFWGTFSLLLFTYLSGQTAWAHCGAGISRPCHVVRECGGNTNKIALTFNGEASISASFQVLDVLAAKGVKGTFFLSGANASNPGYRAFAARAHEEGHLLGNSGWNVDVEGKTDLHAFDVETLAGQRIIANVTGGQPRYYRHMASSSALSETQFTYLFSRGFHVVDWNEETGDAASCSSTDAAGAQSCRLSMLSMVQRINSNRRVTSWVIAQTESFENTTAAILSEQIDLLKAIGYTFYRVDECNAWGPGIWHPAAPFSPSNWQALRASWSSIDQHEVLGLGPTNPLRITGSHFDIDPPVLDADGNVVASTSSATQYRCVFTTSYHSQWQSFVVYSPAVAQNPLQLSCNVPAWPYFGGKVLITVQDAKTGARTVPQDGMPFALSFKPSWFSLNTNNAPLGGGKPLVFTTNSLLFQHTYAVQFVSVDRTEISAPCRTDAPFSLVCTSPAWKYGQGVVEVQLVDTTTGLKVEANPLIGENGAKFVVVEGKAVPFAASLFLQTVLQLPPQCVSNRATVDLSCSAPCQRGYTCCQSLCYVVDDLTTITGQTGALTDKGIADEVVVPEPPAFVPLSAYSPVAAQATAADQLAAMSPAALAAMLLAIQHQQQLTKASTLPRTCTGTAPFGDFSCWPKCGDGQQCCKSQCYTIASSSLTSSSSTSTSPSTPTLSPPPSPSLPSPTPVPTAPVDKSVDIDRLPVTCTGFAPFGDFSCFPSCTGANTQCCDGHCYAV